MKPTSSHRHAQGNHDFSLIFSLFLSWRLGLFVLSRLADRLLPYHPSFPYADTLLTVLFVPRWEYSFANFDGVHYLTIARLGYERAANIQAFFPLYPELMKVISQTLHLNIVTTGLIISNIAFLVLLFVWKKLITKLYSEKTAWYSTLALLVFPTAIFFGAIYTESLFLLFVLLAFYAGYQKQWWLAGIWTLLASATRVTGIFLLPALLVEMWQAKQISLKNLIGLALGSLGLLGYMGFLQQHYHDALSFMHVQSSFGAGRESSKLVLYPQVVWRSLKILLTSRPFDWKYFTYVNEFLAGTLGLVGILAAVRKIRLSFLVFALLSFILPTLTGTFSSMPRYLLTCFPIFIALGFLGEKQPWIYRLWILISIALLIINSVLFLQGYWVA